MSLTFTLTRARRSIYSHTESSRSAEHGPMITRNLSLSPVNTAAISLSLFSFNSTASSDRGNSALISSGVGSRLLNVNAMMAIASRFFILPGVKTRLRSPAPFCIWPQYAWKWPFPRLPGALPAVRRCTRISCPPGPPGPSDGTSPYCSRILPGLSSGGDPGGKKIPDEQTACGGQDIFIPDRPADGGFVDLPLGGDLPLRSWALRAPFPGNTRPGALGSLP